MPNTYASQVIRCYEYWAQVQKLVDGDTIDVRVSVGFDVSIDARLRLKGINAPECHGVKHDSPEYKAGRAATDFLAQHIEIGSWVEVKIYKSNTREKYGRWLAEVFANGKNINEALVASGHASRTSV